MGSAEGLLLTEEGWQRLDAELWALEAQKNSSTRDLRDIVSTSRPGDVEGISIVELHLIERRIQDLRRVLSESIVVGSEDREPGVAGVGSSVAVRWDNGDEETFVIVGPPEVDAVAGRISYKSPVGQALLGRRRGDLVEISTPGGSSGLLVLAVR